MALKDLPWWLLHFVIMLAVKTLYVVARTMFTTEKPLEPALLHEDKRNLDGFELHLRDVISSNLGTAFAASEYIRVRFEGLQGKTVCALDILKSPHPTFLKAKSGNVKEFYIRTGNNSRALDVEQMYNHLRMKKWF